jgi:hypothetical protein
MNNCHRYECFAARVFWTGAIVGALFLATSGIAAAAGLFDTATQADMRLAAQALAEQDGARDRLVIRSSPLARRDRVVRVNAVELARIIPTGADKAADRLARTNDLAGSVTLELFPGVSVTAQRTNLEAPDEGGYVWLGENKGQPSYVSLAIQDGEIVGRVLTGGKLYTIRPISGAVHRIVEIDTSKVPEGAHPQRTPERQIEDRPAKDSPLAEADAKAVTTINVLVAHTVNARNEFGPGSVAVKQQRMNQEINATIARTNNAFNNSNINIKYKRVGGENEVAYGDTTLYGGGGDHSGNLPNYLGTLCDLSFFNCSTIGVANNQTAKFAGVRAARNSTNADLVVLFRKFGAACGIAWEPDLKGIVKPGDQDLGFSVATSSPSYGCLDTDTVAHETGHNMGMNHDRIQNGKDYPSQPSPPPPSQYNFGHVNPNKGFITIMSYFASCPGCIIIPFYSNPNVKFQGTPTGVDAPHAGNFGAADGALRLNNNRGVIAGYR